jgi:hypothetical protein
MSCAFIRSTIKKCAIDLLDYFKTEFPFQIHTVRGFYN